MEITLSLTLPREEESIPVARHIVGNALAEAGVVADCTYDVELALSEACTNVLLHAGPGDAYQVRLQIDEELCELRVVDVGQGFDAAGPRLGKDGVEEGGRGLGLMIALVDTVQFASKPEAGTVVRLEKTLVYRDDSLGGRSHQEPGAPAAS